MTPSPTVGGWGWGYWDAGRSGKSPVLGVQDCGAHELTLMEFKCMLIQHDTSVSHRVNVSHIAILFTFWEEWLRHGHWSQAAGIVLLALPLTSKGTLGK